MVVAIAAAVISIVPGDASFYKVHDDDRSSYLAVEAFCREGGATRNDSLATSNASKKSSSIPSSALMKFSLALNFIVMGMEVLSTHDRFLVVWSHIPYVGADLHTLLLC